MAVSVCVLGVVLGIVAHGVKVAPFVVRPDAVRMWLPMGVRLLRSGRGCGGRCGVPSHGIEVAQIVGEVCPAYQGVKYDIYIMC